MSDRLPTIHDLQMILKEMLACFSRIKWYLVILLLLIFGAKNIILKTMATMTLHLLSLFEVADLGAQTFTKE